MISLNLNVSVALASIFGLLIGSFLNVVIHRLPKILERQWARDYQDWAGTSEAPPEPFNLWKPASHCPLCTARVRWHQNIPVLSFIALRGRCGHCQAPISRKYPLVELATAGLFALCVTRWAWTPTAALWCIFSASLLALAMIDWETTLLPDVIVLPLLWLGLVAADAHWTQTLLSDALWGAVGGYLTLWSVYWAFKLATGKEGMGFGDFKLLACLGAWFGWQMLIPLLLLSSVVGTFVGVALKWRGALREGGYMPFGPFLAGAGFLCLAGSPRFILTTLGL